MKKLLISSIIAISSLSLIAQDKVPLKGAHLSIKLETQEVIKKGNKFIISQQNKEGYWGDPDLPAFTGFAVKCLLLDPSFDPKGTVPAPVKKGIEWLLSQQKEDGGIYGRGMATYSTSASIMALWIAGPEKYKDQIISARNFLINHQTDWGVKGENDTKFDGGIGYGGSL
ncbi:MAG: terpene cyclase/mutase family protein, partial [Verrucomicrobia bacterium]|nr:terpene cyclase/mutase family protein [Verrucomicrobiota bacterium]